MAPSRASVRRLPKGVAHGELRVDGVDRLAGKYWAWRKAAGIGLEGVPHQMFEPNAARDEQPVLLHESHLRVRAGESTLDRNGLPRRACYEGARTTLTSQLDADGRP